MRGVVLLEKGEPDPAIEEPITAIRLDSKFALAHFSYGTALETEGEFSQALNPALTSQHPRKSRAQAGSNVAGLLSFASSNVTSIFITLDESGRQNCQRIVHAIALVRKPTDLSD
jgi:hypothetical protein